VNTRAIHIASRTEQLITVREFVSTAAREVGFSDEDISKIALAVDEACTNIIKHAYQSNPNKRITVSVTQGDDAFVITIVDTGRGFNPSHLHLPDMKEYREHPRRGGLGVYLMKSLMDKVEYDMHPGRHNEVRLTKFLSR
jgi:serine/threonine-protein kinase RsbW